MVNLIDDPDEEKPKKKIPYELFAILGAVVFTTSIVVLVISKPWISVNPGDKFAYYVTSEQNPFEGPSKIITILEVREGWAKFETTRPGSELSTDTDSVENIRTRYLKVTK
jgi:hypothetical protein